jgi:hypothetical protein
MGGLSEAFPHGNWDAWAIWNVRARFLTAGGELAQRAWSDAITHPNYPQLLPGFVARCWAYGGTISVSAPIATGFLFWAALLSLVTGGVALLRGPSLGLLSGLVLVGAPFFLREAPSQYADVPLACFMAGALLLLLLARPALAGAFAGLAAWTKDEGLLFLAVFIVAAALFRRGWLRAAAGAIPAAALVLVFKLAIASGTASTLARSLPSLTQHLTDPGRYEAVLSGFVFMFQAARYGWHHPVMGLLALAVLLRFDFKERKRDMLAGAAVTGGMLAGYFFVYVISPYELGWHIQGSAMRLGAQLWPTLVVAVFAGLCAPESMAVLPAPKRAAKKAKARG